MHDNYSTKIKYSMIFYRKKINCSNYLLPNLVPPSIGLAHTCAARTIFGAYGVLIFNTNTTTNTNHVSSFYRATTFAAWCGIRSAISYGFITVDKNCHLLVITIITLTRSLMSCKYSKHKRQRPQLEGFLL